MAFLTPAVVAGVGLVATAAQTGIQLAAAKRAADAKRQDALSLKAEEGRKAQLLESRSNTLRTRRAAGSGQTGTILDSGSGTEIGRSVLLGQ